MKNSPALRITEELAAARRSFSDWAQALTPAQTIHIAIVHEPFLSYMFSGRKTIESRFSRHRIPPFGRVQPGDLVLLKADKVCGCFTVAWSKFIDLASEPLDNIIKRYGKEICAGEAFWAQKKGSKYATLMGICDVRRLTPITITKRDRRAWLSL